MTSIKNILSRITGLFKNRNTFHHKRTLHPTREWLVGLLLFCLFVSIGGIQSARVFLKYQDVHAEEGVFTETITQYNQTMTDKAESIYSKRKEAFLNLQNNIVPVQKKVDIEVPKTPTEEVATSTNEVTDSTASTSQSIELAN